MPKKARTLAKKKNTFVSGNAGDEKYFYPGGREFFCNQFEFFKQSLRSKNYSNNTFLR